MARTKRDISEAELGVRGIVAANLRVRLRARGWTVTMLADTADVSRGMVYEMLLNNRAATTDVLTRISGALGIEPWEMLKRAPKAAPVRKRTGVHASS